MYCFLNNPEINNKSCRCYGCKIPKHPKNGKWDCDIMSDGQTVCMLQCEVRSTSIIITNNNSQHTLQKGHSVKGYHVIQCDNNNEYSHDPSESECEEGIIQESDSSIINSPYSNGGMTICNLLININ